MWHTKQNKLSEESNRNFMESFKLKGGNAKLVSTDPWLDHVHIAEGLLEEMHLETNGGGGGSTTPTDRFLHMEWAKYT